MLRITAVCSKPMKFCLREKYKRKVSKEDRLFYSSKINRQGVSLAVRVLKTGITD